MSLLLDALYCQNHSRPPIWLMRQAGRYLPEYQKIRKGRALYDMFHCQETIVKVTKLPVDLLNVDAAIVFSDILIVLDGLGISWQFQEGVGPVIKPKVEMGGTFPQKKEAFPYKPLASAIKELKKELKVPLLGFAGAPFTIASYLIEGQTSRDFKKTKTWLYQDPLSFHTLLDIITDALVDLLVVQIESGVDAIQLFDSWAGMLPLEAYQMFCCQYLKKIQEALKNYGIPIILFSRGSSIFAEELAKLKPACISLDWTLPINEVRKKIPTNIALQGNLDPSLLFAKKEVVELHAKKILSAMESDPGFIFNLGHGVLPETPVENVKALIEVIHNWKTSPKSS